MKSISIAIKDITRSFRSTFALLFMFVIPLLVAGIFYVMFGNIAQKGKGEPSITAVKVIVVNLDQGSQQAGNLGEELTKSLQSKDLANVMEVSLGSDAGAARQAVDTQEAAVALIIPEDFSSSFSNDSMTTEIEFYKDPTLTVGPQIVSSIVSQFVDAYAGMKITLAEGLKQAASGKISFEQVGTLISTYHELSHDTYDTRTLIDSQLPPTTDTTNPLLALVGPIMGAMMIFYAFFTGVNAANSILHEDEDGTLKRLFSTPTSQREVLTGKFISVGLTVLIQVIVLMVAARLLFGINWGILPVVALVALGTVCSAATFGILICSLLKNTKQGGVIFGGLLTVTGMLGMINIFTGNYESTQFGIVPLLVPQGWAARAMLFAMNGASVAKILPTFLALIAMSVVFFVIGVWRFQNRYA